MQVSVVVVDVVVGSMVLVVMLILLWNDELNY